MVKSWIFLTLAETLQGRLIKTNPTTTKAAWKHVETIFLDYKCTITITLKDELRVIQMGDLSVVAYFRKIESIVTLLNDLGSPMSDGNDVSYAMYGLTYGGVASHPQAALQRQDTLLPQAFNTMALQDPTNGK
ncbi:hypothetical protein Tco_1092301 [Tanacetum coccineum]|uniref:Retrotransposon gag domain-containing protein n=1 Tax=Tanacetum coccineum TaxID=301880 RepID=A0ABQ5I9I6_9ASTR